MEYNIKFDFYYLNIDSLKEKHCQVLKNMIGSSRLGEFMKYDTMGYISFDESDHKHEYPIIEEVEQYKRKHINCLIYNLPINYKNKGYFDKLILYYSEGKKTPSYGLVFYNSETNDTSHRYLIYGDYTELFYALNDCFNTLYNRDLYSYYIKRYNSIQNLNGLKIQDCPLESDRDKIIEDMLSR